MRPRVKELCEDVETPPPSGGMDTVSTHEGRRLSLLDPFVLRMELFSETGFQC